MRGEEALADELGERRLQEERRILAGDADGRLEAARRASAGTTMKATPQRREHRLRQGADIDDAAVSVEPLHGRQRVAAEAVLAVVVVLDDPGIVLRGDLEEARGARPAAYQAERPLARGRHEDQARRAALAALEVASRRGPPAGARAARRRSRKAPWAPR